MLKILSTIIILGEVFYVVSCFGAVESCYDAHGFPVDENPEDLAFVFYFGPYNVVYTVLFFTYAFAYFVFFNV